MQTTVEYKPSDNKSKEKVTEIIVLSGAMCCSGIYTN